jgi:hypothetical protein
VISDWEWLQDWYATRCDGSWEHEFGVSIDTLDNPGWRLTVDLLGSPLIGHTVDRTLTERTPDDWCSWEVSGNKFVAHGGPKTLSDLVRLFRQWAEPAMTT